MQTEIERHYVADDYALNEKGQLEKWRCRWCFTVKEAGDAFVYQASSEVSPGSPVRQAYERTIGKREATRLVKDIKSHLDTNPLFTRTGG